MLIKMLKFLNTKSSKKIYHLNFFNRGPESAENGTSEALTFRYFLEEHDSGSLVLVFNINYLLVLKLNIFSQK
jgi:hypothetical protein